MKYFNCKYKLRLKHFFKNSLFKPDDSIKNKNYVAFTFIEGKFSNWTLIIIIRDLHKNFIYIGMAIFVI